MAVTAKDDMRAKLRQMFLPGLVTLVTFWALNAIAYFFGVYDKLLWKEPNFSLKVYGIFWCGLIPIGALGAWISRRYGGSRTDRIFSALFPVVSKMFGYVILLPLTLLISGPSSLYFVFGGLDFWLVKYLLAPCVALFIGALPLLRVRGSLQPQKE